MARRIRVLQIVTRLAVRGVPRHVIELAARLDPARYEVEVLAGRSEPGEGSLLAAATARGVPVVFEPALQRAPALRADATALRRIRRHVRVGGYDIVHTHISKAGVLGRFAARRARVPTIVHTHHGRVGELEERGPTGRAMLAAERLAASWSDALVAVSQDTVRYLAEHDIGRPQQYRVIPNGIDVGYFRPPALVDSQPGNGAVIGTIGSLTEEKGLDVLIDALPAVVARHPRVQLRIVGDGPLRAELEARARRRGMDRHVQFAGYVADVRSLLGGFDILVQPSRREGWPLALLEAMAMRKPVVATRVGGVAEVVADGETARLLPPDDPAALADAIATLLADRVALQAMGQAGLERVSTHFTVERMVAAVDELYRELTASNG